jgi:c-di-GMP-binding flagellar brake protein YcgR
MSAPDAERRVTDRKTLRTRATIILGQTQAFEVRTLDLSTGGMGIVAQANPRPGTLMGIRFMLPLKPGGYHPFEARAKVAHSVYSASEQGFKIGLSFIDLSPEAAAAAQRFVSS